MKGVIVRGIGGFYYVDCQGKEFECRAAGKLRLQEITPRVGDEAEMELQIDGSGFVTGIYERKNQLVRPMVANVDTLLLVMAPKPKPDYLLYDKLLLNALVMGVKPVLCVNKSDMPKAQEIATQYERCGCEVLRVSAHTGMGIDRLIELLDGVCCFAGQSGTGKTSLLNCLLKKEEFETGEISKIERGKHTTRQVQLLRFDEKAMLVDTPGFSVMDLEMEPREVAKYYEEFAPYAGKCRFDDCLHLGEQGCVIADKVREEEIPALRYENYSKIVKDLIEFRRNQYD